MKSSRPHVPRLRGGAVGRGETRHDLVDLLLRDNEWWRHDDQVAVDAVGVPPLWPTHQTPPPPPPGGPRRGTRPPPRTAGGAGGSPASPSCNPSARERPRNLHHLLLGPRKPRNALLGSEGEAM